MCVDGSNFAQMTKKKWAGTICHARDIMKLWAWVCFSKLSPPTKFKQCFLVLVKGTLFQILTSCQYDKMRRKFVKTIERFSYNDVVCKSSVLWCLCSNQERIRNVFWCWFVVLIMNTSSLWRLPVGKNILSADFISRLNFQVQHMAYYGYKNAIKMLKC